MQNSWSKRTRFWRLCISPLALLFVAVCSFSTLRADEQKLPIDSADLKVINNVINTIGLDAPAKALIGRGYPAPRGAKYVHFTGSKQTRHFMAVIHDKNGRVTEIRGNGPLLPNKVFKHLSKLSELRVIRVDHNMPPKDSKIPRQEYNGAGIVALKNSKLQEIRIGHAFDDEGMAALSKIQTLKKMDICHSKATDKGVSFFAGHPNLQEVIISSQARPERITNACLQSLATIPNLKRFSLQETFLTYDKGLAYLLPLRGKIVAASFKNTLVLPVDLAKFRLDHPDAAITVSTPSEILASPNSRGLLRWASPEGVDYLKKNGK